MFTTARPRLTTPFRIFTPLHYFIFTLLLVLPTHRPSGVASDIYSVVSNNSEVTLKRGHGNEYKSLGMLQDGETVSSLEEDGDWVKIRTATGRQGWVQKQYLSKTSSTDEAFNMPLESQQTDKQPATPASENEQKLHAPLPEKSPTPDSALPMVGITPKNPQAGIQTATPVPQNEQKINAPLPDISLTPDPPPMAETTPNKPINEQEELRNKLTVVMLENKKLREDERIKWFLAGGGVLTVGWLIGLITCRSRKRKPSLL